jgi:AcrR family transcriptional regulator
MAASEASKRTSNYHSPLRARQAAETRRSIVDAAQELFRDRGWTTTTLPMIAKAAGVSVDTIYSTFGTKSALLMDVLDVAIVGDDDEAAMVDRPDFALLGSGRRPERIRAGVRYTMGVYERSVPMLRTLREAAASDDAARDRLAQYDQDRRDVTAAGMRLILGRDATDEVIDAVWAVVSPDVRTYLVEGRGWSTEQAEDWFVDMVRAMVAQGDATARR